MTDYLGNNHTFTSTTSDSDESKNYNHTKVKATDDVDESNINRKVLPQDVRDFMRNSDNVVSWDVDPITLQDYAENAIIQAFIDTVAKDVSSIDYNVVDSDGNKSESAMEFLKHAHPDRSYRDLVEATVRDLLKYGNAFWVLHRYKDSNELAEIVSPDPATMFLVTDDDGYTEGYAQKQRGSKSDVIETEDVIHFNWATSNDRKYSRGPTETVMDYIDIIEELLIKERLDLVEGGISAIVSQTDDHDTKPLSSNEFDELEKAFDASEGLRHANIFTRGNFERTEIGTNYQDMDIVERYNSHIQKIASAFKIPPSYAGLDYENTNRATDENQTKNYEKKGINVVLQQLQSKINRELIPQLEEDEEKLSYEWSIETDRDTQKVEYYTQLAEAVQDLQSAGIPFDITDDGISIPENAEINTPETEKSIMNIELITDILKTIDEYDSTKIEQITDRPAKKPEEVEECVESIMEDNPEMDKSEAYAICYSQEDSDEDSSELKEPENLSNRQKELVDNVDGVDSFSEAIKYIENSNESRSASINMCKECLGGSLSNSTYYNWLDEVGLE